MTYWIYSPAYDSASGGIVVLHLLAEILRDSGASVCLVTPDTVGYKGLPHVHAEFDSHRKEVGVGVDDVVIYPEIICGNPLSGRRVVRWLLNRPGVIGGDGVFEKDDLIFTYSKNFIVDSEKESYEFSIVATGLELFGKVAGNRRRLGVFIRKGRNYHRQFPLRRIGWLLDSIPYRGNVELAKSFGQCFAVVSYDAETYHSVQAAIAGCLSVVVPRKGLTRRQFRDHYQNGASRYGVAYGFLDIPRALLTRKKLIQTLEEMEVKNQEAVGTFVRIVQENWSA